MQMTNKDRQGSNPAVKGLSNLSTLIKNNGSQKLQETIAERTYDSEFEGVNPIGPISASEGMDVCIWKAMLDRKFRTLGDIAAELSEYGLNKEQVKDRVVTMTHRNWFDRTGTGKNTSYALKKGVKMPGCKKSKGTPSQTEGFHLNQDEVLVHAHDPDAAIHEEQAAFARSMKEEDTEMPAEETHIAAKLPDIDPPLSKDDGTIFCIWNVMRDREPYTTADITLLLGEIGFAKQTIYSAISHLNLKENWFDTTVDDKGTRVYTLRASIEKPERVKRRTGVKKAAEPQTSLDLQPKVPAVPEAPSVKTTKAEDVVRADEKVNEQPLPFVEHRNEKGELVHPITRQLVSELSFLECMAINLPPELYPPLFGAKKVNAKAPFEPDPLPNTGRFDRSWPGAKFIPPKAVEPVKPQPADMSAFVGGLPLHLVGKSSIPNRSVGESEMRLPPSFVERVAGALDKQVMWACMDVPGTLTSVGNSGHAESPPVMGISITIKGMEFSVQDAKAIGRELSEMGFDGGGVVLFTGKKVRITQLMVGGVFCTASEASEIARTLRASGLMDE